MDNEGSQEKQERQEQQIAGPRLQALETEDDEAWAQRQREVAQARTDRTEDWTGTYLHEYAALAPPGPLPLVADGDISPLRLDEGTSSPEHGENDYNGMEISGDEGKNL